MAFDRIRPHYIQIEIQVFTQDNLKSIYTKLNMSNADKNIFNFLLRLHVKEIKVYREQDLSL